MLDLPGFFFCPSRQRYFRVEERSVNRDNPLHADSLRAQDEIQRARKAVCETGHRLHQRILPWLTLLAQREAGGRPALPQLAGALGPAPTWPTAESLQKNHLRRCFQSLGCTASIDLARRTSYTNRHTDLADDYQLAPASFRVLMPNPQQPGTLATLTSHSRLDQLDLSPTASTLRIRQINSHQTTAFINACLPWGDSHDPSYIGYTEGGSSNTGMIAVIPTDRSHPEITYHLNATTIWTAAISPSIAGSSHVSFGTSGELVNFRGAPGRPELTRDLVIRTGSDVFTIAFDQYRPEVVLAGCRDGRIRVLDYRQPYAKDLPAYGVLPGLGHYSGASVSHLAQVDPYRWVSSSTATEISLWDLRLPRLNPCGTRGRWLTYEPATLDGAPTERPSPRPSRAPLVIDLDFRAHTLGLDPALNLGATPAINLFGRGRINRGHSRHQRPSGPRGKPPDTVQLADTYETRTRHDRAAEPLLRYAGHVNTHYRDLGFALHPTGRALAAAGTDHVVRVWDTDRGELLQALASPAADMDRPVGPPADIVDQNLIRQLHWTDIKRQGVDLSLLAAQHQSLLLFGFKP